MDDERPCSRLHPASRFSVYGKIVNEKKTLRSYGTHVLNKINIEYETALEAKAALDGEDGRDFNGSKLRKARK